MPSLPSRGGRRRLHLQRLEPRCVLDAASLRITEVMASNDDTLVDFQGDSSDWLEIYNPSSAAVDLAGMYLTDDSDELTKWRFPAGVSIDPGGFLLVFASDKNTVTPGGEVHTSFRLSAGGEYVGLVGADGQTVVDAYSPEFPEQFEDISYGLAMTTTSTTLVAEGVTARAWRPTSGVYDATWTDVGFDDSVFDIVGPSGFGYEESSGFPNFNGQFNTAVPPGTTSLYVRYDFNLESLADISGLTLRMKYDDGFVAYLNGQQIESVNARASNAWNSTAFTGHDDFDAISFEPFDVSDHASLLQAGPNVLAIHALNFSSNSSDFLVVPELVATRASIVEPEEVGYFENATPGGPNGGTFAGFADEPTFSVPHGFYEAPQSVAISTSTAGAVIVFTTDGSTPAVDDTLTPVNGQLYTGPIAVTGTTTLRATAFKQDFKPSFVRASTYLFLDDVIQQSPSGQTPAGWAPSGTNGQELNYGIDPDILSLYGERAVKDSLAALPAISLTTDLENLFDPQTGIYVNALNRGREWERAASVELIHPDGTEGFSTNAGLRIRGGYHRNDFNPKHAFRLYFRDEYGDGLLDYQLFDEADATRFDVLDLRTAQNYSWAAWGNTINGLQNSYLREVFARDTQADMGQPHTRSNYYHLYVDGQYYGVYMTQERIQEHFGESYFGGDESDYDVVKSDPFESGGTEIADGTDVAWRELFELAQDLADNPGGDADNFWAMQGLNPDGTRNDELEVLLDVDNLIDYMMIIIYTGGHDTGISAFFGNQRANNWFGIRNREAGDMGFQFFLHDNEHSLGAGELVGVVHGTEDIDRTGPFYSNLDDEFEFFNPVFLHQDLLIHPEYKQMFVDRVYELMFNDGPLTASASIARMTERAGQVGPAIIAESARWGDSKRATPYDKADWDAEVAWLLNSYFPGRGNTVLQQLRADGLYTSFSTPAFSQHGGVVPSGYELGIATRGGTIYYSTDGHTDPREIGGGISSSSEVQPYAGAIVLTEGTEVWTRMLTTNGDWSALVKASFTIGALPGDYDASGLVDQQDYSVWRSTYGSTTDLRADGNGDGRVDAADYTVWRDNLGTSSGLDAGPSVSAGITAAPAPTEDPSTGERAAPTAAAWLLAPAATTNSEADAPTPQPSALSQSDLPDDPLLLLALDRVERTSVTGPVDSTLVESAASKEGEASASLDEGLDVNLEAL
ncbi:CotH protein [Posidoniimonas corsicana]|uniref:CotH protein n=1 Tax=Posidoniimonas corsicana TaxID=1938618 RepID=A0A5C5VBK7_9BACT|nr:CotH kinase family protein [Posidoniimonas corsicana]TWT35938.1 CotH protein [Posidoniimonas corsicana]